MPDLQDALRQLYAAPLEDFIAERKRLAADLKAAGDKDDAATLGKVAKPSPAAWALNHVAREAPDELAAWLDVAAELRDASTRSAEVGGDALRAAMSAHRSATANLRAAVRNLAKPGGKALSEPMLDRVAALLQVATGDPEVAERLRAGCITEDTAGAPAVQARGTDAPGDGAKGRGGAAAEDRGGAAAKGRAGGAAKDRGAAAREDAEAAKARAAAQAEARAAAERVADLEAQAADLREQLVTGRETLDERKAAARAAVRRLEDARRALRRTESEVSAAQASVSDAEDAIAAAERELADVREALRESG